MEKVLAINSGSSSFKYKLFSLPDEKVIAKGMADRVGLDDASFEIKLADGTKHVEKTEIPTGQAWIDKWKVFIPRANNIGTELNDDNLNSFVGKPGEICTESFLALGCDLDLTKTEAENLAQYLQTKFARFMHSQAKSSQDSTSKTFRFVPLLDFQHLWTDEELYRKYDLNEDEIALIEMMIKPMGNGGKEA